MKKTTKEGASSTLFLLGVLIIGIALIVVVYMYAPV